MKTKNFVQLSTYIFLIIGLLHLWRIISNWEATIGTVIIPTYASWIAIFITAVMVWNGYRLTSK
ncbi:MAG: hypothetical protein HYT43_01020 [Candidatus Taylorbacteria bacterium]|nr:hypothetical protein [Candidatus Taylorbacteria bacterium]